MPDEIFSYGVEIDSQSAEPAARALADIFDRYLAQIRIDLPNLTGGQQQASRDVGSQIAQQARQATQATQQAAQVAQQELGQIARLDLTKPVEDLRREIQNLLGDAARAEDRLQRMMFVGGGPSQHSAQFNDQIENYYAQIERDRGREAANMARARGTVGNIGDLRAQEKDDEIPIEEFETSIYRDVQEKRRFTLAEQEEMARLEGEVYEAKLQAIQLERGLADREMRELDQYMAQIANVAGDDDANVYLQALTEHEQATNRWLAEETELTRLLAGSRAQAADLASRQTANAVTASQRAAAFVGGSAPAASNAGAGAIGRHTAITVTQASATNAERLAQALQEAAEATERMERLQGTGGVDRRRQEMDTEREKLNLQRQSAQITAQQTENERTAGAAARAGIQDRQRLQEQAHRQTLANLRNAAQAQTLATRLAGQQATQDMQIQAAERLQIARAERVEREQIARAQAQALMEAEERLTIQTRGEAQARLAAQRQAGGGAFRGGMSGGGGWLGNQAQNLLWAGAGALGIYGAEQIVSGGYRAGRGGAQTERMEENFTGVAERIGADGQRMINTIQDVSRGTISEFDAMSLAIQVMAQRFAQGRVDIVDDTAQLVAAARRMSQIYADESGQFLSTQDVFARYVKYVREGNKELVDQFGINNQRVAEVMDVEIEALSGTEGEGLRFAGMLKILEQEMARIGGTTTTAADEIEASEARVKEAMTRISQALIPVTAAGAEAGANIAERFAIGGNGPFNWFGGARDPNLMQNFFKSEAGLLRGMDFSGNMARGIESRFERAGAPAWLTPSAEFLAGNASPQIQEQADRLDVLSKAYEQVNAAATAGVPNADAYAAMLGRVGEAYLENGTIQDHHVQIIMAVIGSVREATDAHEKLAASTDETAVTVEDTSEAMGELSEKLRGSLGPMAYLVDLVGSLAGINPSNLEGTIEGLQQRMEATVGPRVEGTNAIRDELRAVAMETYEAGLINKEQLAQMLGAADEQISQLSGRMLRDDMQGLDVQTELADAEKMILAPFESALQTEEDRKKAIKEGEAEAKRAANELERLQKQAVKEWEQEMKEAAKSFEQTLEKIPGLFSPSDVSEGDVRATELGMYQEKPDELLRQVRIFVDGDDATRAKAGKDYDIPWADIAAAVGMEDPGADDKGRQRVGAAFARAWETNTLWEDRNNIPRFQNPEAVYHYADEQRRGALGRQNLVDYYGLDPRLAGITGLGLLPGRMQGFPGMMPEEMDPLATGLAGGMIGGAQGAADQAAPEFIDRFNATVTEQIAGGSYNAQLAGVGATLLDLVWGGYEGAIESKPWIGAVVDHVAGEVAEIMADQLPVPAA